MTLLERLRLETRPHHDRIEKAVDIERRSTCRESYRRLLARFYGFHVPWEGAAGAAIDDKAFFRRRRKAELLARDLAHLGFHADEIAQLPRCGFLMPVPSNAAALGSMYVIEGSTLGGTIIARSVERHLGLAADSGCAYFRSYGRATARMWKSFGAALLAASSPDVDDVIVASAKRTFETMHDWLSEVQ